MRIEIYFIMILSVCLSALTACDTVQTSPTSQTPNTGISASPNPMSNLLPTNLTKQYQDAPVVITRKNDGQIVHVNLVKFVGSVSSIDTIVSVNNNPVMVDQNGNYSVLLNLVKGQNIIQVKTTQGTEISIDGLTVTFDPPVALVINYPQYDKGADYRQTPLTITGIVNNPAAEVILYQAIDNMTRASVAADGTYSAQMLLKDIPPDASGFSLTAVAKLGDETDSTFINIGLKDGKINGSVSGGPYRGPTADVVPKGPVTIVAGNTTTLDYVVNVRVMNAYSDYYPSGKCDLTVARLADPDHYQDDKGNIIVQTEIPGLEVTLMPSQLTVYPNIRYHIETNVTASPNLASGTYYFMVQGFKGPSPVITIIVKAKGGLSPM